MAGRDGFANNLANKIFGLQKRSGGGVPGEVVRSARFVKEGRATPADVENMRRYLGASRTGAGALKKAAGQARQAIGAANRLSSNLDMIQRGQLGGYIGIAQQTAQSIEQLTRSPLFKRAVENVAMKVFDDPGTAARFLNRTRGLARGAVAGVAAAGVYAEVGRAAFGLGDAIAGNTKSTATRLAESNLALVNADVQSSASERSLALKKAVASQISDMNRGNPLGDTASWWRKKQLNVDSASIGRLEAEQTLGRLGLRSQSEKLFKRAREEALAESTFGSTLGGFLNDKFGVGDDALSTSISQKIQASGERGVQLRQQAEVLAGKREFKLASAVLAEANKELQVGTQAWQNPNEIYKRQVGDRAAERMWSRSQMARAGPRTGD